MSHPLRVRELKLESRVYNAANVASHPLRVRELKQGYILKSDFRLLSHPLRVRELKLCTLRLTVKLLRRTLYGCVN